MKLRNNKFKFQETVQNYKESFKVIKNRSILPFILISFSVLCLSGFYRAFFVLFLKDNLLWSQNFILLFVSLSSLLFLPISLFIIQRLGKIKSKKNIFQGAIITGIFSILFGLLIPMLNFFNALLINLGRWTGSLICNSSRSGLISRKLKENREETGAIDTIFSPLGVALGSLTSGLIIGILDFNLLFILGGIFVIAVVILGKKISKKIA